MIPGNLSLLISQNLNVRSFPGTTLGLIGAAEALAGQTGAAVPMTYVSKEKLLKDMQFRGAISDFHPIKEHIVNADYDPLLLRSNDDDLYGDGNNFEVKTFASHHALTCCTATCCHMNEKQWWSFSKSTYFAPASLHDPQWCTCSLPRCGLLLRCGSILMLRQRGANSKQSLQLWSKRV